MAKYKKIEEPVFITSVTERKSKHGGDIYEVDFKGIVSQKDFKSYIDPGNMNWRRWEPIIDIAQRKGVVLGNLKEKDEGLINADSEVKVHYVVEPTELADILAEFWDNQNGFSKLFK
tara:strand:- start:698 stop:1048 length:351 start_codon:yes stop_codon:yes gene_type:complete